MKSILFFLVVCILVLASTSASAQEISIPAWIKNNAGWWADDEIPDSAFIQGIQFLIEKEIIVIPNLPESSSDKGEFIPAWIKNNAGWWADNQISDKTFVSGIEYLVNVGIIVIEQIDDGILFKSVSEENGMKITYLERTVKQNGQEFVIIENKIEHENGEKVELTLPKSSERIIKISENGEKYLLIDSLSRNELGMTVKTVLHVEENENNRKILYIENDDENIFRKLIEPKHLVFNQGVLEPSKLKFLLKDELSQTYDEIGVYDQKNKPLVIVPTFTASAYSEPGFYTFYKGECDTELHGMLFRDSDCLTVKILTRDHLKYSSSSNAVQILELLGYNSITDTELHNNPSILTKYNKIIMLHNEYVSKPMFDAITSHDNVIFLYPNSLYAEVDVNMIDNTITLIRGHNYPEITITNGFNWINENTHPFEYDDECESWEFYATDGSPDGYMLNCFPENKIWQDQSLLQKLKDL